MELEVTNEKPSRVDSSGSDEFGDFVSSVEKVCKKRPRVGSEDSDELDFSDEFGDSEMNKKKIRVDSDEFAEFDPSEVKRIKEDLLEFLDDSEVGAVNEDLDSFMKSFAEEISAKSCSESTPVAELTSYSGDSPPDLGYLLEASDDELGLPPSSSPSSELRNKAESDRVVDDSVGLGEFWEVDNQISNYDSFDVGYQFSDPNTSGAEFVAVDGLFDYADLGFGSSDFSYRAETYSAV